MGGQSEKGEMRGLSRGGRLQPLKEEEWRAAHILIIYIYIYILDIESTAPTSSRLSLLSISFDPEPDLENPDARPQLRISVIQSLKSRTRDSERRGDVGS